MKNLMLLAAFIFIAASPKAFSYETKTKDCIMSYDDNQRVSKDISSKSKTSKKKVEVKSR